MNDVLYGDENMKCELVDNPEDFLNLNPDVKAFIVRSVFNMCMFDYDFEYPKNLVEFYDNIFILNNEDGLYDVDIYRDICDQFEVRFLSNPIDLIVDITEMIINLSFSGITSLNHNDLYRT